MAHRKPLGTTFSSVFDWEGEYPALMDYLVSEADTWYRVVGVEEKANPEKIGLTLERIAKPHHAPWSRTHQFRWYPRDRRRA